MGQGTGEGLRRACGGKNEICTLVADIWRYKMS